jgi:hypothetical protein
MLNLILLIFIVCLTVKFFSLGVSYLIGLFLDACDFVKSCIKR